MIRSHAFDVPFLHWLRSFPDMVFPEYPLPSHQWVFEAMQLTKHFVEVALQSDKQLQTAKVELDRHFDKKAGNKKAFAQVRGPGAPPILQISSKVEIDAMVASRDGLLIHDIFASLDFIPKLSRTFPVLVGQTSVTILDFAVDSFVVQNSSPVDLTSQDILVMQDQTLMAPKDVADSLSSFWQPIWQRDPASLDFCFETLESLGFVDFLSAVPAQAEIRLTLSDPAIWRKAIRRLRASSARGTDGISAQELKMLPQEAIDSLAHLFAGLDNPFDPSFMLGLVAPDPSLSCRSSMVFGLV